MSERERAIKPLRSSPMLAGQKKINQTTHAGQGESPAGTERCRRHRAHMVMNTEQVFVSERQLKGPLMEHNLVR